MVGVQGGLVGVREFVGRSSGTASQCKFRFEGFGQQRTGRSGGWGEFRGGVEGDMEAAWTVIRIIIIVVVIIIMINNNNKNNIEIII